MRAVAIKRYIIFSYQDYYPDGGMNDALAHTDDLALAVQFCLLARDTYVNLQFYDTVDGMVHKLIIKDKEPVTWDITHLTANKPYYSGPRMTGVELFGRDIV